MLTNSNSLRHSWEFDVHNWHLHVIKNGKWEAGTAKSLSHEDKNLKKPGSCGFLSMLVTHSLQFSSLCLPKEPWVEDAWPLAGTTGTVSRDSSTAEILCGNPSHSTLTASWYFLLIHKLPHNAMDHLMNVTEVRIPLNTSGCVYEGISRAVLLRWDPSHEWGGG